MCMHAHIYISATYIHICINSYTHICIHIQTHACLPIYIPKCIHSCSIYTYIDTYICMSKICIYLHT